MKIKIIPPRTKTGEGQYADHLINGLIDSGFDVEILNDKIFSRPIVKMFFGSLFLKGILKDEQEFILHNMDNLGPFLIRHNKLKCIQNIFDIAPVILPQIHSHKMRFDFKVLLPRLISNSDSIIVPSISTKNDLTSRFNIDEKKINVVPLGVDNSFFSPKIPKKDILNKYGINNEYLIYVGTDNPRKNLKNLILAFLEIYHYIPHDLVLIGPISLKKIIKVIKENNSVYSKKMLDRIVITGYVDYQDLPVLYSAASVFVFPSLYEGFGLPPLEAMACGTPVITANNSSLKEVVDDVGLLLNPLY